MVVQVLLALVLLVSHQRNVSNIGDGPLVGPIITDLQSAIKTADLQHKSDVSIFPFTGSNCRTLASCWPNFNCRNALRNAM